MRHLPAFFFASSRRFGRRRGSALITVTIICAVLVLLVGSLLRYALVERRLNIRHAARIEARNAAESLAEYGAAQIRQKYETRGTFTLNPNGTDALRQPPSSFWAGSRVVTSTSDLSGATYAPASSLDLELIGGTERLVTTGTSNLYYVNPADENNRGDPLSGKWVTRRDVSVIARATVRPPDGGRPITAYVSERISVRGAPLFAHAIFYNMDLEIFNGPPMNITGPVHTNGNLYLYPDDKLNFYGNVTATGNIYKAKKPGDASGDGDSAATRSGSINFLNKTGALVNLYGKDLTRPASSPGSDFWRDSSGGNGTSGTSFANFAANASQAWNGYLQTKDHGIQNYTPVAIGKYVEDPTPGNGVDNSINTGRAIIEPPAIPLGSDANYASKMEVEKQKYSNMAGLYITVTPGTTNGNITLTRRGIDSDGALKSTKTLTMPGNGNLVKFKPYSESTSGGTTTVTSGMYDRHRGKPIDLVELDITALRDAVAEMQKTTSSQDANKRIGDLTTGDWSGVVYIDVTGGPTTRVANESTYLAGSTVPATNTRNTNTAVRIVNGAGKAPSYGTSTPGLTIASNAPIYVKGNFNTTTTNGTNVSSSSGNNPATDYESGEVPCAIVSDAITVLSNGFSDATSKSTASPHASSDIVISAAFLTGIAPTNKNNNGATSGGAHNIIRFLENWDTNDRDTWFRGSLVCLFESRVFTEAHGSGYYNPPNRNWGFNKLFGQGTYPPGTPRVLSYRRVDFTDLNAAEYDATRDSFDWK